MKTGALLCCFTLCLVLSSGIFIDELNNKKDLKKIKFGKQYPRHGLMLLHWFVKNIQIDSYSVIRCVNFHPAVGDYGFHVYENHEFKQNIRTFPECPDDCVYYAVGSLQKPFSQSLPIYVTQDYNNDQGNPLRNIDRIVIRVQRNNPQTVDQVYITQHYENRNQGSAYDPENTYRVSTSLLLEIQDLINEHNNEQQLNNLYGDEIGLSPLLTEAGYDRTDRVNQYSQSHFCSNTRNNAHRFPRSLETNLQCEMPGEIKLEVKSTSNGYAKISWSEIPESLVKNNIKIGLYKDDQQLTNYALGGRTFGTIDTSTCLNSGLQVKLLTTKNDIIWTGPEFKEANGALPTDLKGYDASLQLYTKDGYACARLFIKKSCKDWKTVFYYSWVGFYSSPEDDNKNYRRNRYQYVVNFKKNANQDLSEEYDIYEYQSGTAIGPGVQARFLLDKKYTNDIARTTAWA